MMSFWSGQAPQWIAAVLFALLFPLLSYLVQRRWGGARLAVDVRHILLLTGLTFIVAVLCEAAINPVYAALFDEKLWEYRLLPLHDGNVSALSVLLWSSYGAHLYFMNQTLERRLPSGSRQRFYKACVVGAEAPLVWEVSGNAVFLSLAGEYYAYYLPAEFAHFTSARVIPIYAACAYLGLLVYERLRRRAHDWRIAGACFGAGLLFLAAG